MSVEFDTVLWCGWIIDKETYNSLDYNFKNDYCTQTNYYNESDEYFVGVEYSHAWPGYYLSLGSCLDAELYESDYEKIAAALPELIAKYPNPSLYLIGKIC
jgi:hypothetical protein